MKCLRRNVGAVGPDDRSQFAVELGSRKERRIPKRRKHAVPCLGRAIDLTLRAVLEAQSEPMLTDDLDRRDMHETHTSKLRQRRYPVERQACSRPLPIRLEFSPVKGRPLADESNGAVG